MLAYLCSKPEQSRWFNADNALKTIDAQLPTAMGGDCNEALAAVNALVANLRIMTAETVEMTMLVARVNDAPIRQWAQRYYAPIVNERAKEYGKQVSVTSQRASA